MEVVGIELSLSGSAAGTFAPWASSPLTPILSLTRVACVSMGGAHRQLTSGYVTEESPLYQHSPQFGFLWGNILTLLLSLSVSLSCWSSFLRSLVRHIYWGDCTVRRDKYENAHHQNQGTTIWEFTFRRLKRYFTNLCSVCFEIWHVHIWSTESLANC